MYFGQITSTAICIISCTRNIRLEFCGNLLIGLNVLNMVNFKMAIFLMIIHFDEINSEIICRASSPFGHTVKIARKNQAFNRGGFGYNSSFFIETTVCVRVRCAYLCAAMKFQTNLMLHHNTLYTKLSSFKHHNTKNIDIDQHKHAPDIGENELSTNYRGLHANATKHH